MKQPQTKSPTKKRPLTQSLRKAVFAEFGHRCYYPDCTLPITKKNPLCIHDMTETGDHTHIRLMRPICMVHHNTLTAAERSARVRIRRLRDNGVTIETNQQPLFAEYLIG